MKEPLRRFIALGRDDFGRHASRRVDWASVDAGLFTRIEDRRRTEHARMAKAPSRPWAHFAVWAIALATLLAIVGGRGRERPAAAPTFADADPVVAKISEVRGDGRVLLDGAPAAPGALVRLGDTLETNGADVTVVREGKVRVFIEQGSRVSVGQARDPLAIALERGAVQARVAPVAAGEAFAVDVGGARIAVHGTVLRVARMGGRAAVDLVEGVVSVGRAPRFGSVLGSIVVAPAHVEFAIADCAKTLTVTHDPAVVHPVRFSSEPASAGAPLRGSSHRAARARTEPSAAGSAPPALPLARANGAAAGSAPVPAGAGSTESDARDAIRAAVLACMSRRPRAENVTVVVETTLHLEIGDDGAVRTARFDPPVMAGINECASAAVYKARFGRAGAVEIPVEFKN